MAGSAGRDSAKFMLRLPDGMREQIKAAALANNRSMNSEILARLGDSLYAPDRNAPWDAHDNLLRAARLIENLIRENQELKEQASRTEAISEYYEDPEPEPY
ncbi:Arc family DNA-binding protein [Roseinatronobacter sp. NSM]|uniref:Arc family DNA-binding protein n=1 Tax=Roseinatronobacter sp. NSM TaxID=3457785 RepID=UPI0040362BC3